MVTGDGVELLELLEPPEEELVEPPEEELVEPPEEELVELPELVDAPDLARLVCATCFVA